MDKKTLKELANNLMFDMKEEEYETLSKEFEFLLKEMDKISEFEGIKDVEPLFHPFEIKTSLREDEAKNFITTEEALLNAKEKIGNEIKVPKVVGE